MRIPLILLLTLLSQPVMSQQSQQAPLLEAQALAKRASGPSTLFEKISPQQLDLTFSPHGEPVLRHGGMNRTYGAGTSGVAMGDYDGDGLADVFISDLQGHEHRLLRNLGDWKFEDVTDAAGIASAGSPGRGVAFVDIDNDGDLDLFLCSFDGVNLLYINQGDGTFLEKADAYGLAAKRASIMMAFSDYDRDGDLDAYLLTYGVKAPGATPPPQQVKITIKGNKASVQKEFEEVVQFMLGPDDKGRIVQAGQLDHLFRNDGGQGFTEVSQTAGIEGADQGLSAIWWDYDDNGWPDLFVGNDFFNPDKLYRNNGNGTFTDIIETAMPHTSWFTMGADAGDLNNDGLLDLMSADMSGSNHYKNKMGMGDMSQDAWFLDFPIPRQYMRNALFINSGTQRFKEISHLAGMAATDWSWSIKFGDLDNDGFQDIFITNGITLDVMNGDLLNQARALTPEQEGEFWARQPPKNDNNMAFRNLGELNFEPAGEDWGLDHLGISYGAALGDLDGDGDLDLVVANANEPPSFYRNGSATGNIVRVRLQGKASNSWGIGAKVVVETATGKFTRYLSLSQGYASSNDPVVHVGLGVEERITQMTIHWPSGNVQKFEDLPVNQLYTVTEAEGEKPAQVADEGARAMFGTAVLSKAPIKHIEKPYDDFRQQPLLPKKHSQLGPGMAWGDVDGDGDQDLFLAGAAGSSGQLYLAGPTGLVSLPQPALEQDRSSEDMGALFLDAEGDGDLDLYVVSGGVESAPASSRMKDRLYVNNGLGVFSRAQAGALPDIRDSGSVVSAADYDHDGDLDLFVGGRIIPGQYPRTPQSRLLRNVSDDNTPKFVDATPEDAPQLGGSGLVTSAIWSHADGDEWIDLLVTYEWGSVRLFRNNQGRLVDSTVEAGLSTLTGWWNGIAAADADADGDIDYAVTNYGLNTKYHASFSKPALLYYGDFEDNGKYRIVEGEYEEETLFPVRGLSCSSGAIPIIRKEFENFQSFAVASLEDIYKPLGLDRAQKFSANTLESGVWINDGAGRFTFQALPRAAQISPGFGLIFSEIDGDGYPDIYLAQNFFSNQLETGRMDGGISLLLRGKGDGSFSPLSAKNTGLIVPGDAKSVTFHDLNKDGRPDFVIGVNDDRLQGFVNQTAARYLTMRVEGPKGNPQAIGARILVRRTDGSVQATEVYAGGGYLSQGPATISVGHSVELPVESVTVQWPTGEVRQLPVSEEMTSLRIPYGES